MRIRHLRLGRRDTCERAANTQASQQASMEMQFSARCKPEQEYDYYLQALCFLMQAAQHDHLNSTYPCKLSNEACSYSTGLSANIQHLSEGQNQYESYSSQNTLNSAQSCLLITRTG
jgi:hypothetical protein